MAEFTDGLRDNLVTANSKAMAHELILAHLIARVLGNDADAIATLREECCDDHEAIYAARNVPAGPIHLFVQRTLADIEQVFAFAKDIATGE